MAFWLKILISLSGIYKTITLRKDSQKVVCPNRWVSKLDIHLLVHKISYRKLYLQLDTLGKTAGLMA